MQRTCRVFSFLETTTIGVTYESVMISHDRWSIVEGMVYMCFSCFMMCLVGIYLDKVIPSSEFGDHQHPCFVFTWIFRCFKKEKLDVVQTNEPTKKLNNSINSNDSEEQFELKYLDSDAYEDVADEVK